MGYRSQVGLAMTKQGVEDFWKRVGSADVPGWLRESVAGLFEGADAHEVHEETGAEFWLWEGIEWYVGRDGRDDVICVMDALRGMCVDLYAYLRLGENKSDTEIIGSFWDNPFHVEEARRISFVTPAAPQ